MRQRSNDVPTTRSFPEVVVITPHRHSNYHLPFASFSLSRFTLVIFYHGLLCKYKCMTDRWEPVCMLKSYLAVVCRICVSVTTMFRLPEEVGCSLRLNPGSSYHPSSTFQLQLLPLPVSEATQRLDCTILVN